MHIRCQSHPYLENSAWGRQLNLGWTHQPGIHPSTATSVDRNGAGIRRQCGTVCHHPGFLNDKHVTRGPFSESDAFRPVSSSLSNHTLLGKSGRDVMWGNTVCRDHGFQEKGFQADKGMWYTTPPPQTPTAHVIFNCLVLLIILLDMPAFSCLGMVSFLKAGFESGFSILKKFRVLRTAQLVSKRGLKNSRAISTGLALGSPSLQGPWRLLVQTLNDGFPRRPHGTESLTLRFPERGRELFSRNGRVVGILRDKIDDSRPGLLGQSGPQCIFL